MSYRIRASIGTLAKLGLVNIYLDEEPTTAYLLQYTEKGCLARCRYCAQSMYNKSSKDYLSRITWPSIDLDTLLHAISSNRAFNRICLQTVLKERFVYEVLEILKHFKEYDIDIPISIAITPVAETFLNEIKRLGVDRIGIGLDASSPRIFRVVDKPYSWDIYIKFIEKAVKIFGKDNVYVHLIAGLGEDLKEFIHTMMYLRRLGAKIALFSYTYVKGIEKFPGVDILTYRLIQIARLLLEEGYDPYAYIDFDKRLVVKDLPVDPRQALLTCGCPYCNRPFYNESPRGPIYNYPSLKALHRRTDWIEELRSIGVRI